MTVLLIERFAFCLAVLFCVTAHQNGSKRQDIPGQGTTKPMINNNYYCSGVFCDPGYEPYPNIVSAMTGYNIFKGNAFNLGVEQDPGFQTNYIFTPVGKDKDGRYALDSGITIRAISKCDFSMNTVVASTVAELKRITRDTKTMSSGWKTNPPITIAVEKGSFSAGTEIPPLWDQYGSTNDDFKQHEEYFTKTKGTLTMNSATCALYTMQINKRKPPPFHPTVEALILKIIKTKDNDDRMKLLHVFVQSFGTHYLQGATMGARLTISRRYTKKQVIEAGMEKIDKCNKGRMSVFGVYEKADDSCSGVDDDNTKNMIDDLYKKEYMLSYGSKPAESLTEWGNQDFSSPLPIKMELAPITDFFSKDFLKHIDRIETHIPLGQMEKMHTDSKNLYLSYCDKYQKELGIAKCNASASEIVCGWNDGCDPIHDTCEQVGIDEVNCTANTYDLIRDITTKIMERFALQRQMGEEITFEDFVQEELKEAMKGRAYYIVAVDKQYGHLAKHLTSAVDVTNFTDTYIRASGRNVFRHDFYQFETVIGWTSKQRPAKPGAFKKHMDIIIDRQSDKTRPCRRLDLESYNERLEAMHKKGYGIDFYLETVLTSVPDAKKNYWHDATYERKNAMFRYSSEGTTPDYYPVTIEECKNPNGESVFIDVAIAYGMTHGRH